MSGEAGTRVAAACEAATGEIARRGDATSALLGTVSRSAAENMLEVPTKVTTQAVTSHLHGSLFNRG